MIDDHNHFLSTFFAMYLLNCYHDIYFFPKPDTLFTTSCNSSSVRLYFKFYDIVFRSSNSRFYFWLGSTSSNIDLLPFSLKGFPTFSVTLVRKISKLTHYPARSFATASKASYTILYFLSKPRVRAVLRISETSHCR